MKILVLFVTLGLSCVHGDTPADCRYEDVLGKWHFSESGRRHALPLKCNHLRKVVHNTFISLEPNNRAVDQLGNVGTWTLVYNQGFEVKINQRSYFAFSSYEDQGDQVTSYCDRTFIGRACDVTSRNCACFRAVKESEVPPRTTKKLATVESRQKIRKFMNDHDFIDRINRAQNSWTAKAYPEFEHYTLDDMIKRKGGLNSAVNHKAKPLLSKPASTEQKLRAQKLPKNFDWRDVDGNNFVSSVKDQGNCGSCYAFASLGAVEARLRILTNNERQDDFSEQDILDCSDLSQACEGGFAYLIAGRYAKESGLVWEKSNPYRAEKGLNCPRTKRNFKTFVANYSYVGGYYGACNEEAMMDVLYHEGPFPIGVMVHDDFVQYSGGIYKYSGLSSKYDPLVVVNHAVVLVGYGVDRETHQKYWIVKNSWGSSWGEDGYFRIVRGTNDCGIESLGFNFQVIP